MSPLAWLKLAAIAALLAALTGAAVWAHHTIWQGGYEQAQAEARDLADAQAQRNRDLQRAAELKYTVVAEVRDRFITRTIKEVRNATDNLAACVLSEPARRLLNDGAQCAREDRPASCGAGEQVLQPK